MKGDMVHRAYSREEIGRMTRMDLIILAHERCPGEPGQAAPGKIANLAEAKAAKARVLARRESWEPWS